MRDRLTDGHPESPLLLYVGRLGAEKKLKTLRYGRYRQVYICYQRRGAEQYMTKGKGGEVLSLSVCVLVLVLVDCVSVVCWSACRMPA